MDRERHVELNGLREERVVVGVPVRLPRVREGADEATAAAVRDRALELRRGGDGIEERELRDWHEAPARAAAEVRDPAVVRALVGERQLRFFDLALPEQAERRIEHRLLEMLAVEQFDALLRVASAKRDVLHVTPLGAGARALVAHRAQHAERAAVRPLGAAPVQLQVFEAGVVHADTERARAIRSFQVFLPEPRGFQDVPVRVDRAVVRESNDLVRHFVSSAGPTIPHGARMKEKTCEPRTRSGRSASVRRSGSPAA
jgi:hypothetical protein